MTPQIDTICYACGRQEHMKRDAYCTEGGGRAINVVNWDTEKMCKNEQPNHSWKKKARND
jgi:hypothetical protein